MGKPKAPKPTDPVKVGQAQTGSNIGSAVAQANLNNVNQVTPYGSLTYGQTGTSTYTDPTTGQTYSIPQFTATQTLSPEQRALYDTNVQTQQNLANVCLLYTSPSPRDS